MLCEVKIFVSIPEFVKTCFVHLEIVSLDTALLGFMKLMNSLFSPFRSVSVSFI